MEKLNWRAIHDCQFSGNEDLLKTLLEAKGVEDVEAFLNVNETRTHDPRLFRNIMEGIQVVRNVSKGKKRIFLQVDSDTDGYTSASYFYQAMKKINPEIEIVYNVHKNKEHGLLFKDVKGIEDIELYVVPDASIDESNLKAIRELNPNAPILILDHHQIDPDMFDLLLKETVLINCTDGVYPNPTLSGVGVVHKFFELYHYLEGNVTEFTQYRDFLDLVALGMIADNMDMRNLETRYYALEGLKRMNRSNGFIEELSLRLENDMKLGHTITSYGWTIAPKINGCIRFGKQQEKIDLFRAMIGEQEDIEYQPRKPRGTPKEAPRPPKEIHSLQKTMARVACNAKNRQDTQVRNIMKKIDLKIVEDNLNENSIIIVDGTEIIKAKTLTGLVANKIASKYHRPTIILKDTGKTELIDADKEESEENTTKVFGGSGRAYSEGKILDFKTFLTSFGTFNSCLGHEGAFGVQIPEINIQRTLDIANERISKDDLITVHKVDFEIDASKLKNKDITQIADSFAIWGNKVNEPKFAITNIRVNASEVYGYGENKGFIKFTYGDVDYIKKYCPKGDYDELTLNDREGFGVNKKDLNITVIGSFTYNVFEEKYYPQVRINHFYTEEAEDITDVESITANSPNSPEDDLSIEDIF